MDGGSFRVVLEGGTQTGEDPELARQRLAKLFRCPPDRVEALLRAAPRVIKSGLAYHSARKYQAAVIRVGGVCRLEAMPAAREDALRAAAEAPRPVPWPSRGPSLAPPRAPRSPRPVPGRDLWRRT